MTSTEARGAQRRVTLEDVARHAGVSRALVSIVMRDAPGASAPTRERVMASAQELGYRPDARARALAGNSSRLIGVVFGTAYAFHFELLDGLYAEAEQRGFNLLLSAITGTRDERKAVQSLEDFNFDGLVMLGPSTTDPVRAGNIPMAVVGWHVDDPNVDVVRTSDDVAYRLAVEHLVSLGHKRIAHLDGGDSLVSQSRRDAYEAAMKEQGLERHIRILESAGETQLDGLRAAQEMLRSRRALPTAIVAFNDDVAVAAIGVLQQHGINVPGEISVIGYDDSLLAQQPDVDLTSIAQEPRELARLAIERLEERHLGRDVADRELVIEPTLVIRSTTAAAPSGRQSR